MKSRWLLLVGLVVLAYGCSSGVSADKSREMHDMEKRVNDEAMKKNPPPPGEGPSM